MSSGAGSDQDGAPLQAPAEARSARMKPLRSVLRVVVAAALLAVVLSGETGALFRRTLLATPWLPLLFTAQTVAGAFIEAARLGLLLNCFGLSVPRTRLVRVVLGSAFLGACIPGGTGET